MASENFLKTVVPSPLKLHPTDVMSAIETILDPQAQVPLGKTDRIADVIIAGNRINVTLACAPGEQEAYNPVRTQIEENIRAIPEAKDAKIFVVMTSHEKEKKEVQDNPLFRGRFEMSEVRHILAVASGKGGVGKSTTTVNLAYALKKMGLKVGILDADLYGPSIPKMLEVNEKPEADENNLLIPLEKDGIQLISMGFLVEEDAPIIWRGPVVQKAIQQFLSQVRWKDIDVLLVDLPPGTGDIQLTLVSKAAITGAVVVSTPQDVALLDAKKAIGMFDKVEVPVWGVIENMSYYQCPSCGERSEIFSHGGAKSVAEQLKVPFLGDVPLQLKIREMTDGAQQKALVEDAVLGHPYRQVAAYLAQKINQLDADSSKTVA